MDLPLKVDVDNILDIEKEWKSKGFLPHLFPFIVMIGLLSYSVIEVGSKYHSPGQMLRKDGKKSSLKFGNILIFCADTFHKSVLPSPWDEVLRVSISIGYTKKLAYL